MELKTSDQAATELNMTRDTLIKYIGRHSELRPAKQAPKVNLLLWSDEEIKRVAEHRMTKSKGGRPKKT